MSINLNIDGVSKNVISPEVNIDGVWRQVNIVSNNIDGVWRESFNRNVYKVKLYRYGVLYDTLSVAKGSSVTLPTVPIVYDDDIAHYGWTKTAGNTTRDYSVTAKITPTADMELYAVFSFSVTTEASKSASFAVPNTSSSSVATYTVDITDAVPNTSWTATKTIYKPVQSSTIETGYTSYSVVHETVSTSTSSGTATSSGVINFSVTDTKTSYTLMTGTGSSSSTPTKSTFYTYSQTVVKYTGYKITTQYRSSYGNYIVSLYNGDTLYDTIEVKQGTTYTLPHYTTDKNNVLLGWSVTPESTVVKYTTNAVIRPTGDLSLYAVFADYSYLETDGNGYFTFTGCYSTTTESYSASGGHNVTTSYQSYSMTITFTNGSTKTITLGNDEGETTVRFDSAVGVIDVPVPEGSTSSSSGDTYRVTVSRSYNCTVRRYLY